MREILFRAKRIDNNEWCYGFLADTNLICNWGETGDAKEYNDFLIKDETLGQYTGLTDKNSKKIFEGDIVELELQNFYSPERLSIISKNEKFIYKVIFKNGCFGLESKIKRFTSFDGFCNAKVEVIGNIYDNLELIGE